MTLQRAIDAQRRERDARLITGDAIAATIAHQLKQPLTAMITRSYTGLRWLDRAAPELDKAKTGFRQIADDGHRAAAVIDSIRASFRKDARVTAPLDITTSLKKPSHCSRTIWKSTEYPSKLSEQSGCCR